MDETNNSRTTDNDHSVTFCKEEQSLEINLTTELKSTNGNETGNFEFKEGGYGWFVAIACSICFGFFIGNVNAYSLIYKKFILEYKHETHVVSLAAWIGSTSNCVQSLFCSISSVLVYLFGARKVAVAGGLISSLGLLLSAFVRNMKLYFLTYGIMLGIGQSLLVSAFFSILPHYFKKRIGLANGVMTFLGALITVSLPFIIELCLEKLGLSNTFYVLASISFLTILCGFTFIQRLPEKKPEKYTKRIKESFKLKIFKKKRFNVWVISGFIGFFGYLIPVYTIVCAYTSHYCSLLFPEYNPAIAPSLFGAVSGMSGLIFGKINDSLHLSPTYFHVLSFLIGGIVQIMLPFATTFVTLCVLIGLFGVVDGLFLNFIVPCAIEVAKSHKLANQAVGYYFSITSIPVMAGPLFAGYIYEWYQSYDMAYFIGGSVCIVASIFLIIFYPELFVSKIVTNIRNKRRIDTMEPCDTDKIDENVMMNASLL